MLAREVGTAFPQHQPIRTVRAAPSRRRGLRGAGLTPRSQGPPQMPGHGAGGCHQGARETQAREALSPRWEGTAPVVGTVGHRQMQLRPHLIPGPVVAVGRWWSGG